RISLFGLRLFAALGIIQVRFFSTTASNTYNLQNEQAFLEGSEQHHKMIAFRKLLEYIFVPFQVFDSILVKQSP
ncbi:MAG: hypothetical protein ACE5HS_14540, partial [bacterium]